MKTCKCHQCICWDYKENGPEKWGNLCEEYSLCETGAQQSPIDITNPQSNSSNTLEFNYDESLLHIKWNEHSLYVHFLEDGFDQLVTYNGTTYQQIQLHFHAPSEHHLEGKPFPIEIHFVHKSEEGKLLVVGVFVKEGGHNDHLDNIFTNIPGNQGDDLVARDGITVNPADLLPLEKTFFNYPGSLTTPPCSEGVTWIVMKEPIEASVDQIEYFRNEIICDNIRPIQPLNERTITVADKS